MTPPPPTRPPPQAPLLIRPSSRPSPPPSRDVVPTYGLHHLSRSLASLHAQETILEDDISRGRAEALAKLESKSPGQRKSSPPPAKRHLRRARTHSERTPHSFVVSQPGVDGGRARARAFVATLLGESALDRRPAVLPEDVGLLQAGPAGERETYLALCDGVLLCRFV
jgi:hypothetical protein